MEEFINSLNLPFTGKYGAGEYIITLNNSNDFSDLYNIISTNNEFHLDETSITTDNNAMFLFFTDDYEIRITADFQKDIYRAIIGER